MKSSPQLRLDSFWWISVPYLIAMASLAGLSALSGNGWAFGHFFGVFILLGIPLACISGWWTVMILYRLWVSHTLRADARTLAMLCLAALATFVWGSYAASGW
jgi:hypothetical protein